MRSIENPKFIEPLATKIENVALKLDEYALANTTVREITIDALKAAYPAMAADFVPGIVHAAAVKRGMKVRN